MTKLEKERILVLKVVADTVSDTKLKLNLSDRKAIRKYALDEISKIKNGNSTAFSYNFDE